MSIAVDLDRVRAEAESHGATTYLLTTQADGRPHAVGVHPQWRDDEVLLDCGRTTRLNAEQRTLVSLLWPPPEPGGYSLIVDGNARLEGETVVVTPTKAVLHRPGPAPDPTSSCTSDCVRLVKS
jgi:hypothetical protein